MSSRESTAGFRVDCIGGVDVDDEAVVGVGGC